MQPDVDVDVDADVVKQTFDAVQEAVRTGHDMLVPEGGLTTSSFLRRLITNELDTLVGHKCQCSLADSAHIYLRVSADEKDKDWSHLLETHLSNTRFDGIILLDVYTADDAVSSSSTSSDWQRLPAGIHSNLLIADSMFHLKSCRVYRNSLVSHTFVGSNSVLMNCGHVSAATMMDESPLSSMILHGRLDIVVGPESGGGRKLRLDIHSTMVEVGMQLRAASSEDHLSAPQDTKSPSSKIQPFNILQHDTVVRDTPTIQNVLLCSSASIIGACLVKNAILQSRASITNSSTVSNVLMQWNATISDNSTVDSMLLMEQSHCGPSSIVRASVMGPDTHVSAGEIHASVFGPNTNSHHQSLIIGVLWPLGRGNVGYGANVGSNHTGRTADQEAVAGEGIFWGLSCVIKFPIDLSFAPYSIVAAGTQFGQQRICMPFSLIKTAEDHNDQTVIIVPGWVLQSTPYTLARNERKFAIRRKAKRHAHYTGWKIFRPSIIEMCRSAKAHLEIAKAENSLDTLSGIGNCKLTEGACDRGIHAYRDCIHRYILQGLLTWVILVTSDDENGFVDVAIRHEFLDGSQAAPILKPPVDYAATVEWAHFPWDTEQSNENEWNYQRGLLLEEFPMQDPSKPLNWLKELLNKHIELEKDYALRVAKCKRRDNMRGVAIIPGYAESHVAADEDPVVVDVQKKAEATESFIQQFLAKLSNE